MDVKKFAVAAIYILALCSAFGITMYFYLQTPTKVFYLETDDGELELRYSCRMEGNEIAQRENAEAAHARYQLRAKEIGRDIAVSMDEVMSKGNSLKMREQLRKVNQDRDQRERDLTHQIRSEFGCRVSVVR